MSIVKLIFPSNMTTNQQDVRRWTLLKPYEELTVKDLFTKVRTYISDPGTTFIISWFDGIDYCTVGTNADVKEAVKCLESTKLTENCLRFFVSIIPNSEGKEPFINPALEQRCHSTEPPSHTDVKNIAVYIPGEVLLSTESVERDETAVASHSTTESTEESAEESEHNRHNDQLNGSAPVLQTIVAEPLWPDECRRVAPRYSLVTGIPSGLNPINNSSNIREDTATAAETHSMRGRQAVKDINRKHRAKTPKDFHNELFKLLRQMGFQQQDKTLKSVIKSEGPDINKVVEKLSKM